MALTDFWSVFTYAFRPDPITRRREDRLVGAGVIQPEGVPGLGDNDGIPGRGSNRIRLRDSNDFIDLSSVTNRQTRYKEYERMRSIAEVDTALETLADEACIAGPTPIETFYDGRVTMRWLYENRRDRPFLVYAWDFEIGDWCLAWAKDPRITKTAKTRRIFLDDGTDFRATPDHRVLLPNQEWTTVGELKRGSELMAFYRLPPREDLNPLKTGQFPRVQSRRHGWMTERQFADMERRGGPDPDLAEVDECRRYIAAQWSTRQVEAKTGRKWITVKNWFEKLGFTTAEIAWLGKHSEARRVVHTEDCPEEEVFDLSVDRVHNFCGQSVVFHNCQPNEKDHVIEISVENAAVADELQHLFLNRRMLNMDRYLWGDVKNGLCKGDHFYELLIDLDEPKSGVLGLQRLPAESMYRIETTKGKLLEFQQAADGPDYQALVNQVEVGTFNIESTRC